MLKRTATKILSSALAALMLAASLALPARAEISRYGGETTAPPPEITAQAAMIVNLDTGETKFASSDTEFEQYRAEFQQWCSAHGNPTGCQ